MGHDVEKIKAGIDDIIIKTLITAQPELWHVYRSCQPEDYENSLCFQVLGFDIMIDDTLKPWLIEVNHAPSFATESPFDLNLKSKLLEDTFRILNLTQKKKNFLLCQARVQFQRRILTGKIQKLSQEEKDSKRAEYDAYRDQQEPAVAGGYRMIYPIRDNEIKAARFAKMLDTARDHYDYFSSGGKKGKEPGSLKSMREEE